MVKDKAGSGVGRKKEYPVRLTLPLSAEMFAGLDRMVQADETRLDLIRAAIEIELARRQGMPPRPAKKG
jgi:hypothetical protein